MKIFLVTFFSFFLLDFSSCSEISVERTDAKLTSLTAQSLANSALSFDNSALNLGALNHSVVSIKSIFSNRFGIPELLTDDVDENEKDLKRILSLPGLTNPENIYQALKNDFLVEKMYNNLVPHLMLYFYRYNQAKYDFRILSLELEMDDFYKEVIRRNRLEILLDNKNILFSDYAEIIFDDIDHIKSLQYYIYLNNFADIDLIKTFMDSESDDYIEKWVYAALTSNMPDIFICGYHVQVFELLKSRKFWTKKAIEKDIYPYLFDRIDLIITHLFDENDHDYYRTLNTICFGPDSAEVYANNIRNSSDPVYSLNLFLDCASFANQKVLFGKLYRDFNLSSGQLKSVFAYNRNYDENIDSIASIEVFKMLFDIHEVLTASERQGFYHQSCFVHVLRKYFLIESIEWDESELDIEFKAPIEILELGFPEHVMIHQEFDSPEKLKNALYFLPSGSKFINLTVFGAFVLDFLELLPSQLCLISSENFKWFANSNRLRNLVTTNIPVESNNSPHFVIKLEELRKISNESSGFALIDDETLSWVKVLNP